MQIQGSFVERDIVWKVYFKSDLYPDFSINIGSSNYEVISGYSTVSLTNPDLSVYFTNEAIEITTESPEDTFAPIVKHSATVNLLTNQYIGQYFWAESPLDIRCEIIRNDEVVFSGFVTQGSYSQSYVDSYDELNISCVDYLSVLEYYNYANISSSTYNSYKTQATNVTFEQIFNNSLIDSLDFVNGSKTKFLYDGSKDSTLLQNRILQDIQISELNFLGDDEDSVITKEDVLTQILTYLNLHLIQLGKDYVLYDNDYIGNISEKTTNFYDVWNNYEEVSKQFETSPEYPYLMKKGFYGSADTNLSISDVYNKIQVNCNLEDNDDAIASPFDEDYSIQIYPRKYLYQTEVISAGEGKTAYNAFIDYIRNNKRDISYDGFTVVDYYIQQISNQNWTLYGGTEIKSDYSRVHQDILNYVPYDSEGNPYKQYYIPSLYRDRPGITSLYSIGCITKKQEDVNKDIKAEKPTNLSMSSYIVISINGNEDDTEAGHMPTDDQLIDAMPIAVYQGNFSSGVYSPADEDTTNYLLFQGKIQYVSTEWTKLTRIWDEVVSPPGQDTFIGINYIWHQTPDYFKDQNCYRTTKFYTVDHPTSIQDDSSFDGSAQNYSDKRQSSYMDLSFANSLDKRKYFEYNYTRLDNGVSNVDNIKKLSVFECQLIIGNKTFVETVNSDGSSTYSWVTYDSSLDKTENQQSFTLGIDPNKGDYIIGQEYDIENTVTFDMNIGNNKGFAIPIKKSDNLSGNITFKILGPFQLQWNDITRRHPTMCRHTKYTDNYKYILAHCTSIVIKDFSCKLLSDNSGLNILSEKDLIYVSTEDKTYTNSNEVDFDIVSGLTSQECYDKSIENKVYMNYPILKGGSVVTKIVNKNYQSEDETDQENPQPVSAKAEEFYIDQYFREYSKPRIIFQVPVNNLYLKNISENQQLDLFAMYTCFRSLKTKSFKLIGIDYTSKDNLRTLTFKEIPEEFGKPADDYDWTDWSEVGSDKELIEVDQGGPNEEIEADPAKISKYFTITNTSNKPNVITVTINVPSKKQHYYYTTDDEKWVRVTDTVKTFNLGLLEKIRFRCIFQGDIENQKPYLSFSDSIGWCNVSGNLQALSQGDSFGDNSLQATFAKSLFEEKTHWTFDGFELPSTNLCNGCYNSIFKKSGITKIDFVLPATNLLEKCYEGMFMSCTELVSCNENLLPATTLQPYCYSFMFDGCTKLVSAPKLLASNLVSYCYNYMFNKCQSLQTIADMSNIRETAYYSCNHMFSECTSLTSIPTYVFSDNITLTESCYQGMFSLCTGITSVTILKRDLQGDRCFCMLFSGCKNLSKIIYYPNEIGEQTNEENYTYDWVTGVASSGTWYNANNQNFSQMGTSLIPEGWVVYNAIPVDKENIEDFFTITNTSSNTIYSFAFREFELDKHTYINGANASLQLCFGKNSYYNVLYTTDDEFWITYDFKKSIVFTEGQHIRISMIYNVDFDYSAYNYATPVIFFSTTNTSTTYGPSFKVSGHLSTLVNGQNYKVKTKSPYLASLFNNQFEITVDNVTVDFTEIVDGGCTYMFRKCRIKNIYFDIKKIGKSGFGGMFNFASFYPDNDGGLINDCVHGLFENSQIVLSEKSFIQMFENSGGEEIKINMTQDLPNKCFSEMFYNNKSLKKIYYGCSKLGPQDDNTNPTYNWVNGVSSTGNWYNLNDYNYHTTGTSLIPVGWIVDDKEVEPENPYDHIIPSGSPGIQDYFTITNKSVSALSFTIIVPEDESANKYYNKIFSYNINDTGWKSSDNMAQVNLVIPGNYGYIRLKRNWSDTMDNISPLALSINGNINISGYEITLKYGSSYLSYLDNTITTNPFGSYPGLYTYVRGTVTWEGYNPSK